MQVNAPPDCAVYQKVLRDRDTVTDNLKGQCVVKNTRMVGINLSF